MSRTTLIKNGRVFTNRMFLPKGHVVIRNQEVVDVLDGEAPEMPPGTRVIDARGQLVAPGFIDVHVHGGGGGDASDAEFESLEKICRTHAKFGTTGLLITHYPANPKETLHQLRVSKEYIEGQKRGIGAKALGIHMEGPFVNAEKKGALREEHIRKPTVEEFYAMQGIAGGHIRVMTLAPEMEGAIEVIKAARDEGVVCSVGHSNASHDETIRGINAGISHCTHIYNAMRRTHHRDPGVIGTVLINNAITVEVIADYYHIHPTLLTMILMVKPMDKIVLITDALRMTGSPEKEFDADGRHVCIRHGLAMLDDGTIAGSILTMNKGVKNLVDTGRIPQEEAFRMASMNPAAVAGVADRKGALLPGRDADLVIMDEDYNVLLTMVEGSIVYEVDPMEWPVEAYQ